MVTQILFSIIKTRGRISILKEQISEMESDLSAINMFEEINYFKTNMHIKEEKVGNALKILL